MIFKRRRYHLGRCRRILRAGCALYRRKWKSLSPGELAQIEDLLGRLDLAVLAKDKKEAAELARKVEQVIPSTFQKNILDYAWEIGGALVFALVVATVVRQMWFEPMEIPSGSMRPTFQELDRLVVSKTAFGLNIPLTTGHFYFDPDLVQRAGVFIFTAQDMDIPDQDTRYFVVFPGKRRLIKRVMGKPGDTLYFYGGQIYGFDREGNDLTELRSSESLEGVDAVPFISFDGKVAPGIPDRHGLLSPIYLKQMNQKLGRLSLLGDGSIRGELFDGERWYSDNPKEENESALHTYAQAYGMRNYAMARLLTRAEVLQFSTGAVEGLDETPYYLELRHNPSLTYPQPRLARDSQGRVRPVLSPEVSLIPLEASHLDALRDQLYTARFIVQGGRARADRPESPVPADSPYLPTLAGVPDGRYQFQDGAAYNVGFGGLLTALPDDHPLYEPKHLETLFNLGMEFNTLFSPHKRDQVYFPARYAYFRNGELWTMGGPFLQANDPTLKAFNTREEMRQQAATRVHPYRAFRDYGPPLKEDGTLDIGFIKTFGLKVPEGGYLALGDNYASSSDSRQFGFVPEANIRGAPAQIVWPPGSRWGPPKQAPAPFVNLPRLIVWSLAGLFLIAYGSHRIWRKRRPTFKKRS